VYRNTNTHTQSKTKIRGKNSKKVTDSRTTQLNDWICKMFDLEYRCRTDTALELKAYLLEWCQAPPEVLPRHSSSASRRVSSVSAQ
jgi:hypothetical protein